MARIQFRAVCSRLTVGATAAMVVLLAGGLGQRWLDRLLIAADAAPAQLKQPLSTLPMRLGAWQGTDIPLDARVVEVAGADDYVNRRYVEEDTGETADLYVSYAARPAKMLSHRPEVCFVTHGWTHADTRKDAIALPSGQKIGCLIHRFIRHDPVTETVVVLNYYILRGQYTTEWTDFWGPQSRLPNLLHDPNFYVAQVQVSIAAGASPGLQSTEATARQLTALIIPIIDKIMPCSAGHESLSD